MMVNGRKTAPAIVAEYPCIWMRSNGSRKKAPPSAPVEQQGHDIDAGERARTKQPERHHRRARLSFVPDERNEQEQAAGERRHHRHVSRSVAVGERDQSEGDAAETGEGQQRARPVDPGRRFRIIALRQMTPCDPERGRCEERVDQKDEVPGQVVDDPTPHQRPGRGGNGRKSRPRADGPAALGLRECGADHRERTRNEKRGADALNRPRGDELRHARSNSAPDRCDGEYREAGHEHSPASKPVAARAADQEESGEAQDISVDHPLNRRGRCREILRDRGQGDIDHRLVDIGDDRGENGRNQHPALLPGRAVDRAARRPDGLLIARPCPRIDQDQSPPIRFAPAQSGTQRLQPWHAGMRYSSATHSMRDGLPLRSGVAKVIVPAAREGAGGDRLCRGCEEKPGRLDSERFRSAPRTA